MMAEQRPVVLMMPDTNNTNSTTTTTSSSSGGGGGGGGTVMEIRPTQTSALKCPRCDSSNTKFCYYNNYSLSQPRHFCKACKRYWTRGGTLRNVPVGGGCRKNKRVKKNPSTSATNPSSALAPPQTISSSGQLSNNPFFYDVLTGYHHTLHHSIYDLQPQMNALDLGFSHHNNNNGDDYQAAGAGYGANNPISQFQQSASSVLLQDYPLFGPAASLLASSFKQPKKLADDYCPSSLFLHYDQEDMQGSAGRINVEVMDQQVKVEGDLDHVNGNSWQQLSCDNTFDAMSTAAHVSTEPFMYWNPAMGSGWPDANNCGSSMAPLI